MKKAIVTILIPAINDEKTIGKLIKDCLNMKTFLIRPIVIIDSKNTDNTKIVAKKAGAKVIYIGKGKGKGWAIAKAIPFVTGDYCVQIDSDYQFLPSDIPSLLKPLQRAYDVTLGTRYQKGAHIEKGSVTLLKRFGSYFLSAVTSIFAMQRVTDVMAGMKGFKTSVLKTIVPKTEHFGYEAELVIRAAKKHYKILNVPISYKKRIIGESNVSSFKHGFLVLETIVQTALKS